MVADTESLQRVEAVLSQELFIRRLVLGLAIGVGQQFFSLGDQGSRSLLLPSYFLPPKLSPGRSGFGLLWILSRVRVANSPSVSCFLGNIECE